MGAPDPDLPSMMPPTRRGRLAAFGLAAVAAAALGVMQFHALPLLAGLLAGASSTPPTTANLQLARGLFFGMGMLGLIVALLLALHARAILRSGQNPPNDWWLWRETFIVRGARAKRIARLSLLASAVMAGLCIGLTAFILDALEKVSPYALRPGVTVIEQSTLKTSKPSTP